jgi:HK97 gp10 family phage protein
LPRSQFIVEDKGAPRRACRDGLRDIAGGIRDEARAGTPVRSGRLRAGWRVGRLADGDPTVTNEVDYAPFVEYGTRHMPPRAMLGRALARYRDWS